MTKKKTDTVDPNEPPVIDEKLADEKAMTLEEHATRCGHVNQFDQHGNLKRAHPSEHKAWIADNVRTRMRQKFGGHVQHPKITAENYDAIVAECLGISVGGRMPPAGKG